MSGILLVIEKRVKVERDVLDALTAAGFIVVRGDPKAFHIIPSAQPVSDPLVLQAALSAIGEYTNNANDNGNGVRNRFARNLATALGHGDAVVLK